MILWNMILIWIWGLRGIYVFAQNVYGLDEEYLNNIFPIRKH